MRMSNQISDQKKESFKRIYLQKQRELEAQMEEEAARAAARGNDLPTLEEIAEAEEKLKKKEVSERSTSSSKSAKGTRGKKKKSKTGIKFSKKTGKAIRHMILDDKTLRTYDVKHLPRYENHEKVAFDPAQDISINWNAETREYEMRGDVKRQNTGNPLGKGGYKPGFAASRYKRGNPDMPDRLSEEESIQLGAKKGVAQAKKILSDREKAKKDEYIPINVMDLENLSEQELAILKAAAKIEAVLRQAKEDIAFFVEEFVMIEDKDAPEPMVHFNLWPKQREALKAFEENKLTISLKARQLGLSWLALAYATHGLIFRPGYSVVALSKREEEAKELVRRVRLILEYMPPFIIRHAKDKTIPPDYNGPTWDATTTYIQIFHPNSKVPSMFTSFTSSPDSARSFTASLVILDEWAFQMYAQEIWAAAYPVINRPTGGKVIGISTAKIGSFFEEVWKKAIKGKNNFYPIFLPWYSDPRRTYEWYENTKSELPNSYLQEYPATPEDAFSAGEQTAFPEFDAEVHTIDPFEIPEHWRRWMSCDNGYDHPFAWYWYAVDEDGDIYVYREFSREKDDPKLLYSDQAAKVVEYSTQITLKDGDLSFEVEPLDFCVAGLDAWNTHHRDDKGKTLIDYYREGGMQIGFKRAITDRKLRKAVVHEYLKIRGEGENRRSKLHIFKTCKLLIETLPKLPKDNTDPEKVADCAIDNQYDSLSYGLVVYHIDKSLGLREESPMIRKHKDDIARRSRKLSRKRKYV